MSDKQYSVLCGVGVVCAIAIIAMAKSVACITNAVFKAQDDDLNIDLNKIDIKDSISDNCEF